MTSPNPVWFITGCSTGFGLELARLTLARGWRTVLTARQLLRNKLQDVENEIRGLIRNFGYHLGKVTARDFEPPRAYARQLLKDMVAVRDFAEAQQRALPVIDQAVTQYERFVGSGNAMRDSAAIALAYAAA